MNKFLTLCFVLTLVCIKGFTQTVLISPNGDGGFENGNTFASNGWTVVTGGNNNWYVGTAAKNTGSNGVYIDKNTPAGTTNTYNNTISQTNHFYRDVMIPADATNIKLSFLLRSVGEAGIDHLLIYFAPTNITPMAGKPAPGTTGITGASLVYNQTETYSTFTAQTINLPAALAGNTVRFIFTWQNDDNKKGVDPPAAIDDISLIYTPLPACTTPAAPTGTSVSSSSSTSFSGTIMPPSPAPTGYLVITSTSSPLTAFPADGTVYTQGDNIGGGKVQYVGTTTSYTTSQTLLSNTIYYTFVYSYNANCSVAPFYSTTSATASIPTCPTPVTGLAASSIIYNSFVLNWTAPSGNAPLTYTVDVSASSDFSTHVTGYPVAQSGTSKTVSGLSGNTTYYYSVTANNSNTGCANTAVTGNLTTPLTPCSGMPVAGTASAATSSFCSTGSTMVTVTGYSNASGLTFQWLKSTNNINFSNISNATGISVSTGPITVTTYYYCKVTCNNLGGKSANSSTATVSIVYPPTAAISVPSTACFGEAPQVIISGTAGDVVTYTDGTTSQTVIITSNNNYIFNATNLPVGKTTFTITKVEHGSSCPNTSPNASASITVNPLPDAGTIAVSSGTGYVQLNNSIVLTDGSGGGGTWSVSNSNAAVSSSTASQATLSGKIPGTDDVTYTTINDGNGCSNKVARTIIITAEFVTRINGSFDDYHTWNTGTTSGLIASTSLIPQSSTSVEVQHALSLNVNYNSGSYFAITGSGTMEILPNIYFGSAGGTVSFNSKSVIVRSTAAGTGAIGQMAGTIGNADNVTVERYTSTGNDATGKRAWRVVTSPITNKTIRQSWQEGGASTSNYGTQVTGESLTPDQAASEGFDYIGGGNHTSIKYYNYSSSLNPSGYWEPILSNNTTGTSVSVRDQPAYLLFVRGDRTVNTTTGSGVTTLRATGVLNQTPLTITVPRARPYTLVGNPYAAPVNFDNIYNSSISKTFVIWNSRQGNYGAYNSVIRNGADDYTVVPFNASSFSNNSAKYIQSGSAFFVSPASVLTDGSLTINEAAKGATASGGVSTYKEVPETDKKLWVNLNLKDSDTSLTIADGVLSRFDAAYATGIDEDDAIKQPNISENLSISSNRDTLMIEARPDVQANDTIQLKLWNVSKRNYQFQVKTDNFSPSVDMHAYLEDGYLKTRQEVSLAGDITAINFNVSSDSGSWQSDRFRIVFISNAVVLPVTLTGITATAQSNGVLVKWTVTNETNINTYTVERSADGGKTYVGIGTQSANNAGASRTAYTLLDAQPKTGSNLYHIRIEAKDGTVSYSAVATILITAGSRINIAIYPNPVRDGKVNVQFANLAAGAYTASVYSSKGQIIYQKKITIAASNAIQNEELRLGKGLAQGSYQLSIADGKGKLVTETKLVVSH